MNDPKAFDFDSSSLTWWEEALAWVLVAIVLTGVVRIVWWLL